MLRENLKESFYKNRPVEATIFQSVQFFFKTGIYPRFSTMLNTMVQKFWLQTLLGTEIWLYGPFFRYYGLFWPVPQSDEKFELRSRAHLKAGIIYYIFCNTLWGQTQSHKKLWSYFPKFWSFFEALIWEKSIFSRPLKRKRCH